MKLDLCIQIFEESSNIIFHQNPSRGSRVVLCGRTGGRMDRHDEILRSRLKMAPLKKLQWNRRVQTPNRQHHEFGMKLAHSQNRSVFLTSENVRDFLLPRSFSNDCHLTYHPNTNEMHTCEGVQLHSIHTNMFRSLLWPSSGCLLKHPPSLLSDSIWWKFNIHS